MARSERTKQTTQIHVQPRRLILWLILITTAVLTAFTLLGFAGRFWLLDLMAQFRVQYVIALAICAPLLWLSGRSWRWSLTALPALAINTVLLAPFYLPAPPPPADSTPLRVLTMNVLLNNTNYDGIIAAIEASDADLVAISELTPPLAERLAQLELTYPYQLLEPQAGRHFGIGLLSRQPWDTAVAVPLVDDNLPAIRASLTIDDQPVTVWAVHPVPPYRVYGHHLRNAQLASVGAQLQTDDATAIVLGDLNTTPFGSAFRHLQNQAAVKSAALSHGLAPTWRRIPFPPMLAIDHILVSENIYTKEYIVGADIGSDHYPVMADLRLTFP